MKLVVRIVETNEDWVAKIGGGVPYSKYGHQSLVLKQGIEDGVYLLLTVVEKAYARCWTRSLGRGKCPHPSDRSGSGLM